MSDKHTPAEIPRVRLWGRPVKPMALGILMALFAVGSNCRGRFAETTGYDQLLAIVATVALFTMVVSWILRKQALFEIALLLTAGLFTARAVGVALEVGHPFAGLLPFSVAVLAGGSYVLEKADQFHYWGK